MEYSPLVGGFGIILNNGRAALLTASSLKFDPNVRYILKVKIYIYLRSMLICLKFDLNSKFRAFGLLKLRQLHVLV